MAWCVLKMKPPCLVGDCVNLDNELATNSNMHDEFGMSESHLQLAVCTATDCSTSCTYLNGTSKSVSEERLVKVLTRSMLDVARAMVTMHEAAPRSLSMLGESSCIGNATCNAGTSTTAITIGSGVCARDQESCHYGEFAKSILHFGFDLRFLTMTIFHSFLKSMLMLATMHGKSLYSALYYVQCFTY
jgi:hypothetical protein